MSPGLQQLWGPISVCLPCLNVKLNVMRTFSFSSLFKPWAPSSEDPQAWRCNLCSTTPPVGCSNGQASLPSCISYDWSWNPWLTDLNERNRTWPELTNQNDFSFWPKHWPEVNQGSKLGQSLHYFYWNVGRIKSGSHFLWLKIPK